MALLPFNGTVVSEGDHGRRGGEEDQRHLSYLPDDPVAARDAVNALVQSCLDQGRATRTVGFVEEQL
jgi:hypothetical protein